jgi:hypothetical protein
MGGLMSGQQAFEAGMVNRVVPGLGDLDAATEEMANRLATGGPEALRATKNLLNAIDGSLDHEQGRRGAELSAKVLALPGGASRCWKPSWAGREPAKGGGVEDAILGDGVGGGARLAVVHGDGAGEAGERGQDPVVRGKVEARQQQAVAAGLEAHARVDVAGPDELHARVITEHFGGIERVVDEGDLAVDQN